MLKNYLFVALRTLRRRPGTAALHIGGLAVGLACCFLAGLYVQDELRYDRFHEAADRIFQLSDVRQFGDRTTSLLGTHGEEIEALRTGIPGVEAVAVTERLEGIVRRAGREGVETEDAIFADEGFFSVFTFPLSRGDASVLGEPNQVVLSASFAARMFGDADPLGQTLEFERAGFGVRDSTALELTVAGIALDAPGASSIRFDLLIAGQTIVQSFGDPAPALAEGGQTYIRTAAASDTVTVKAALDRIAEAKEDHSFGTRLGTRTRPLPELHFAFSSTGIAGKQRYLSLFSAVAALVLLLACINYANLATALALGRAREVGVRKAVGARRGQLRRQFLAEAGVLAASAGIAAVALAALVLPAFNTFFDKRVALGDVGVAGAAGAVCIVALTALVAGAYPAFILARFDPARVLKGTVGGGGRSRVRQALVVVQFAVTAVLLVGTAVITSQLRYARTADLGFHGDQAVTIPLRTASLAAQRDALKQEFATLPGVRRASLTSGGPGEMIMVLQLESLNEGPPVRAYYAHADADYAEALGLRLTAGRWFREGEPEESVVLNEAAARAIGLVTSDPEAAIGATIPGFRGSTDERAVVGVLEDFHFRSLRSEIGPVAYFPLRGEANQFFLALQLDRADLPGALATVRTAWEQLAPEHPFQATFVDDRFAGQLSEDRQFGQLIGAFALVAVVLALLGLVGLAAHAAERRRKEVGVRKVLGARVAGLVVLLTRDYAALLAVALAVAVPVAVLLARRWLDDFAYPVPLGAGPFLLLGVLAALALGTVAALAWRAATADPVESLRYE